MTVSGKKINFYTWLNFFFTSLNILIHKISDDDSINIRQTIQRSHTQKKSVQMELGDLSNLLKKKIISENSKEEHKEEDLDDNFLKMCNSI